VVSDVTEFRNRRAVLTHRKPIDRFFIRTALSNELILTARRFIAALPRINANSVSVANGGERRESLISFVGVAMKLRAPRLLLGRRQVVLGRQ
jgi:hypothetical protein